MQNQSTGVEYHEAQEKERWPLRLLPELGEFSALFVPGASPCLVFKYASSPPKIVGLGGGTIYNLCQFNSFKCERGFLYADEKVYITLIPSLLVTHCDRDCFKRHNSP